MAEQQQQSNLPGSAAILPEEKKNVLHTPGMTSLLKPEMPQGMQVAFSVKQNFALAAEQIFIHALNRTVWVYRERLQAVDMMLSKIRNVAMESLATQPGINYVTDMVFYTEESAALREFLFTLQTQFFSQFGEFQTHWTDLIGHIAESLTCHVAGNEEIKKLALVPADLTDRMFEPVHMKNLLLANNWLIMFIFIALWGRVYTYDELRAINRRQNTANAG